MTGGPVLWGCSWSQAAHLEGQARLPGVSRVPGLTLHSDQLLRPCLAALSCVTTRELGLDCGCLNCEGDGAGACLPLG